MQLHQVATAPIDCVVSAFSVGETERCSVPACGGGTVTARATVLTPAQGAGKACPPLEQQQSCNTAACPAIDNVASGVRWRLVSSDPFEAFVWQVFRSKLAHYLAIDENRLLVNSVMSGSTVVEVTILNAVGDAARNYVDQLERVAGNTSSGLNIVTSAEVNVGTGVLEPTPTVSDETTTIYHHCGCGERWRRAFDQPHCGLCGEAIEKGKGKRKHADRDDNNAGRREQVGTRRARIALSFCGTVGSTRSEFSTIRIRQSDKGRSDKEQNEEQPVKRLAAQFSFIVGALPSSSGEHDCRLAAGAKDVAQRVKEQDQAQREASIWFVGAQRRATVWVIRAQRRATVWVIRAQDASHSSGRGATHSDRGDQDWQRTRCGLIWRCLQGQVARQHNCCQASQDKHSRRRQGGVCRIRGRSQQEG
jgi:hypothetical protein